MEQESINLVKSLLSDFGITGGLYIIIIGSFILYMPKLIRAHFNTIKEMHEQFSKNLDKIVNSFEKKIDESNQWHNKHNEKLEKTNYRLQMIEDNLKNNK